LTFPESHIIFFFLLDLLKKGSDSLPRVKSKHQFSAFYIIMIKQIQFFKATKAVSLARMFSMPENMTL